MITITEKEFFNKTEDPLTEISFIKEYICPDNKYYTISIYKINDLYGYREKIKDIPITFKTEDDARSYLNGKYKFNQIKYE